jgi:hypothetical protein
MNTMLESTNIPSPETCDSSLNLINLSLGSAPVIKAVDLEDYGIPCTTNDRICVSQVLLCRGQSFSLRFREAAIDLANHYINQGLKCLVVESHLHLTLWYTR